MDEHQNSVMIALMPMTTDWCRIELPHMCLVYVGEISDLPITAFNELGKDASSIAMLANPISLKTNGIDVFGDETKVDVIRLRPSSELMAMRRQVEKWNASKFTFKPHVTVGPTGMGVGDVPNFIAFDRIAVYWGNECMTFWLKR